MHCSISSQWIYLFIYSFMLSVLNPRKAGIWKVRSRLMMVIGRSFNLQEKQEICKT